jgi:uncharacterized protein YbjT (DUF2867 family)
MMPSSKLSQGNFADYDLVLADNFARSAKYNQISQIIYLGGIIPNDYSLSRHLISRLEVEQTLEASKVPLTSLRSGLILGPDGSSFRIMYNLVKRLPLMICPSWTGTLSNPISIWDIVKALVFCVNNPEVYKKKYDIGGKTTLSYIEMMKILAKKLNRKRFLLIVPFFSPKLSKLWVTKVTGAPKELVYPLIGSLKSHMIANIYKALPENQMPSMSYAESIDKILLERENLKKIPSAFTFTGYNNENQVRSIQRLETLYRFTAQEVAELYFKWLNNLFSFLSVTQSNSIISIYLKGFNRALIVLKKDSFYSSSDYCLFYIKDGLLSEGKGRGRLIFRTIMESRYIMVEIHEFIPRLPWFIYKYTQAIIHLLMMKLFNKYLLRLQRNSIATRR